jgi:hypothetical protein
MEPLMVNKQSAFLVRAASPMMSYAVLVAMMVVLVT